jgi:hypothetical protein
MQIPDVINGTFELLGGILLFTNVVQLFKDKQLKGVRIIPTALFMLWGYWNLFYYPNLNQWYSFIGGLVVVAANTVWVILAIYYRKEKKND